MKENCGYPHPDPTTFPKGMRIVSHKCVGCGKNSYLWDYPINWKEELWKKLRYNNILHFQLINIVRPFFKEFQEETLYEKILRKQKPVFSNPTPRKCRGHKPSWNPEFDVVDQKCTKCGGFYDRKTKTNPENLTPGHLWSRVAHSVKWDLRNVHAQCGNCNFQHEFDPYPFQEYFRRIFGQEAYDQLHYDYVHTRPYKTFELQELLETLKKKFDYLLSKAL